MSFPWHLKWNTQQRRTSRVFSLRAVCCRLGSTYVFFKSTTAEWSKAESEERAEGPRPVVVGDLLILDEVANSYNGGTRSRRTTVGLRSMGRRGGWQREICRCGVRRCAQRLCTSQRFFGSIVNSVDWNGRMGI